MLDPHQPGLSAASDSEWLTIEKVNCGTAANGATLAADKRSVTVLGTWLPYNDIVLKAAPNTDGEARTATLTLTIDGESTPLTMNVTQAGVAAGTPRITVTGLNNYAVPPFASEATQPRTFTVNATYDWTISVPEGDTWYTVSPLQGPANSDIEVTVTPTVAERSPSYRRTAGWRPNSLSPSVRRPTRMSLAGFPRPGPSTRRRNSPPT